MSKKDEFEALANQWVQHCKEVMLSSDMRDYLNHPAYQKLVALGDEAVPFVIERYRCDDFTPWGFLLEDITGQGIIESRSRFNPSDIKRRWLAWWESNKSSSDDDGDDKALSRPEQTAASKRTA